MADNKTVILDIQVNANDALKNIVAAKDAIAQLKDEQKQLEEQLKNGQGTQAMKERLAMISVEIKDLNGVIRENSKEIDNQIKTYKNAETMVGKYDNGFTRFLTAPGLWMQRITTNEPDDDMIEVGIAAVCAVLPEKEGADRW